jgi:hypothetical protein
MPPGMVDLSVRDLIVLVQDAGESFEDFIQDPTGWLENKIEEAAQAVRDAWEGITDPKSSDGLFDILVDWGGDVLAGVIFSQVKDQIDTENPFLLLEGDCLTDSAYRENNSEECQQFLVDCSAQFGKTGGFVVSASECGACEEPDFTPTGPDGTCVDPAPQGYCEDGVTAKDNAEGTNCEEYSQFGFCEDEVTKKADQEGTNCEEFWTDDGPTEVDCAAQGRLHVPGDASTETASACGDCLPTHNTEDDGTCTEWTDGGPTEEECTDQNRVYRPSNGTGMDSSCGGCLEGFELGGTEGTECVPEGVEEPCPGNQIRNEETRECEDPPLTFVEGDPCTTEDGNAGTYDSEGGCVPDWENTGPSVDDCAALGKTHISGDPSEQQASECGGCINSTWNPVGAEGECVAPGCDESTFQNEVTETTTVPYGTAARPQAPTYTEINGVCTKTTYEVVVADPTQADCEAEGKVLGEGEESNTCVEIPVEETCTNGAIDAPECEDCGDGSTPDQHENNDCRKPLKVTDDTCGPDTFTKERTVEVSVGSGEPPAPSTTYIEEDGACTKLTTVYVAGPVIVGPECDDENITPENAEACGKQLCNGVYIDIELPCVPPPPPEGCEDPEEADFGRGCEKPCPDDANIGISDALCGDTTVTTCLDETANNFNEEGPCDYGPVEDICENGAIDYPECTECADGSLPDFETGCAGGPIEDPCDDPVYAAENPTECTSGPECVDCTCAEYAAANPEECLGNPPPPEGGGGGGGGGGGQGDREPIEIGISGDPELLARQEFPITDYLSGLFTGRR